MKTPIVLLLFNRPEHTAQVFARIRELAPERLFVIADGPREDRPGEAELCAQARASVMDAIDWSCEVSTDFSDTNMGCARRVSSGLNWVFGQVEEAIILEDDCLVDASFFPYAERLLEEYREDEGIMSISAARLAAFTPDEPDLPYSRSAYFHSWGWATWRRAWEHYQHSLYGWRQRFSPSEIRDLLGTPEQARYWSYIYDRTHRRDNSWAFRFQLACWEQNAFTLVPRVNMSHNIGFDETATHTLPDVPNPCETAEAFALPQLLPADTPRNFSYERKIASTLQLMPLIKRARLKFTQVATGILRSFLA